MLCLDSLTSKRLRAAADVPGRGQTVLLFQPLLGDLARAASLLRARPG